MALALIWIPLAAVITALVVGSLVLASVREQRKLDAAIAAGTARVTERHATEGDDLPAAA